MTLHFEIAADAAALAEKAAALLDEFAAQCVAERGRFLLALAGGSTPKVLYRLWGERGKVDWSRVHLLFGDERCVPPDHPDSNARMVEESLLARLAVRPTIHRMAGEDADPDRAARAYEATLRSLLGNDGRMDMALLGIGSDGHTASLFPGSSALKERERLCVAGPGPDGKSRRLTLTVPALKGARRLMFLAAGPGKAEILHAVAEGPEEPERLPSQFFIRDGALEVTLALDEAAAGRLKKG